MTLETIATRSLAESFTGFRCWADASATQILDREAGSASREVLLATHVAPAIRRVSADSGAFRDAGGTTQEDLLDVLLNTTVDSLLMPIIGASGSGKSHLVLWLREMMREQVRSAQHRIIYVPKGKTSLVGVIELILEGYSGGAFDELREAVRTASTSMDDRERALRLRNDLAIRISQADPDAGGQDRRQHRSYVSANLPAFLNDAVIEELLLAPGGALERVITDATSGANEEAAQFTGEDLAIELAVYAQDQLGAKAKSFLGQLSHPELLETAVGMLNESRDRALSQVFGVAPTQLFGVMNELRQRILEESPEQRLVLMIEDFTLLQGIQHDLLEAMIANPRPDGDGVLKMAPMSTVMAVTSGFLEGVFTAIGGDTVRTRIEDHGHLYTLDAAYGAGVDAAAAYDAGVVRSLVGRYLNAVRVGAEAISTAHPDTPNACGACHHRDKCLPAFGAGDDEGYGLYPLNASAIDRMIRGRQRDFNPRDMLAMLQRTLTAHGQDLADGRFPSEDWAQLFDPRAHRRPALPTLSLEVQRAAESTQKGQQRSIVLTFWGGVPATLGNLDPAIHDAFQIPQIDGARIADPAPIRAGRTPSRTGDRPAFDNIGEAVQQWRDRDRLDADKAREVRRFVGDAILGALDPESALLGKGFIDRCFAPERDIVVIDAQGGGGSKSKDRFAITIDRDPAGVYLVEGILRASDAAVPAAQRVQSSDWTFENGAAYLAALMNFATEGARALDSYLGNRLDVERKERELSQCALLYSGMVLGIGDASTSEGMLAAAYSTRDSDWRHLPPRLAALYKRLQDNRLTTRPFAFEAAHIRRGNVNQSIGIDPGGVLKTLRAFSSTWTLPDLDEGSQGYALSRLLVDQLGPALDEAREHLATWLGTTGRVVGRPKDWTTTMKVIQTASEGARSRGYLVAPVKRVGEEQASPAIVASAVQKVDELLVTWDSLTPAKRGYVLAGLPWARLESVQAQVEAVELSLKRTKDKADQGAEAGVEGTALSAFHETLDALDADLASLCVPEASP